MWEGRGFPKCDGVVSRLNRQINTKILHRIFKHLKDILQTAAIKMAFIRWSPGIEEVAMDTGDTASGHTWTIIYYSGNPFVCLFCFVLCFGGLYVCVIVSGWGCMGKHHIAKTL